ASPGTRWLLIIGAAMQKTTVLIDGHELGVHAGGFLPFAFDLTDALQDGAVHQLVLRLDNRHDPDLPPGKPFEDLDFCWYGGLYRDVRLHACPPVHITDAATAGEVAGGGIFVRTVKATAESATLDLRVHVRNGGPSGRLRLGFELKLAGQTVWCGASGPVEMPPGAARHVDHEFTFAQPRLWSPEHPELYDLHVSVIAADGTTLDHAQQRVGIRRIHFSRSGGFVLNGVRRRLRGTNRHQEFPRVGYAAPPAAQYRDARRIKEAGFDYVRLSHYPPSPAFLDACDELGLVVMNCLPGWQYLGGELFRQRCFDSARGMIRRDRNHPCVVLWELSLNETEMDAAFISALHRIGHEEHPGDQMFTCGWMEGYDVYLRSRQHGGIHTWERDDHALVVAEYGDWEFFAANAGFDQKTGAGMFAHWSNARKFRGDGERGMRRQAWNHMIALNDTLSSRGVLDGQWCMFDYARGYDPLRAACGVMDVFRLPKFSYHFYRSQRDAGEDGGARWSGGPVVFIASHWLPTSALSVPVFSNCDRVELRLNGEPVAGPAKRKTAFTQHLPHPPFFFELPRFIPGTLEVTGYLNGRARCAHRVTTPDVPVALNLHVDDLGIRPAAGDPDLVMAHAEVRDAGGTLCVTSADEIEFSTDGDVQPIGPNRVAAEAGIASAVLRIPPDGRGFILRARVVSGAPLSAEHVARPAVRAMNGEAALLPDAPPGIRGGAR
ncbi:MAG TPA: glycoside hydrolase family 2 TIM barrel-domain containing protein, partial [Lacunisphaera sp.]|nr:glycoside hydrolase family 2 TIM barrel-domain containing protein [Lacunisphaera sp.]